MMELSVTSVLLFTFVINLLIVRFIRNWKVERKNYPNGPWGVPVLGHLPFFGSYPPETFAKWREQYGDIFRIRLGSWKTVIINGFDAIKEAAEKNDAFSSRPAFMTSKILRDISGEVSLAFGPFNETYMLQRKLTASALRMVTTLRCASTEEIIIEEADKLSNRLLKYTGPKDVRPDIQYAAASVICQVLYGKGTDIEAELNVIVDSANKVIRFTKNGNPLDVMPWLRYIIPWRVSAFRNMLMENREGRLKKIADHMETYSAHNIRDVADALYAAEIEDKRTHSDKGLSRARLMSTLSDLQGAGFDTSNKSLQWLILYMSKYPEVQNRVQQEIDDVVGTGYAVQWKDKTKLVYTQATIFEVMRMISVVPFGLPKFTTENTKLQGFDIDKDTVVFFNIHSVSHDKTFWGDPENFRPERLLTSEKQLDTEKISHIIPFSLGRRKCVGEFLARMEMFLLFTNVIRMCTFGAPDGEDLDLTPDPGLVYSPKELHVVVKARQ